MRFTKKAVKGLGPKYAGNNSKRANQKKYFDLAENETIFVARGKARPIMISAFAQQQKVESLAHFHSQDL